MYIFFKIADMLFLHDSISTFVQRFLLRSIFPMIQDIIDHQFKANGILVLDNYVKW